MRPRLVARIWLEDLALQSPHISATCEQTKLTSETAENGREAFAMGIRKPIIWSVSNGSTTYAKLIITPQLTFGKLYFISAKRSPMRDRFDPANAVFHIPKTQWLAALGQSLWRSAGALPERCASADFKGDASIAWPLAHGRPSNSTAIVQARPSA
jgi:hypothetical protein